MTDSAASDKAVVEFVIQKPLTFRHNENRDTPRLIRSAIFEGDVFIADFNSYKLIQRSRKEYLKASQFVLIFTLISKINIVKKTKNYVEDIDPRHKKVFEVISQAGAEVGQDVYVVGGYVRDFYLDRTKSADELDIDFVTIGSGIELAKKVSRTAGR